MIIPTQVKLIDCFSFVKGRKNAFDICSELNSLVSNKSKRFSVWYHSDSTYIISGEVTNSDWIKLNLESDFMRN